ncbi:uncharacterized protein SCHCODRAFT_02268419 [Schizophyllum commune H4-8]|uniref:uncharacterized protein n=1 Tax=Schizophyllum commune (strain H4-8 / FGSC 9210) TaxID=578458 RepID=UPI00215F925C|nr:uncharacterized protein SCHCODRAFT_02268419 [Schizophyllum commune H4-8]KAI5894064.1 hypothetical protein SCHCODRAFT_02268419 [Schizophyllum commune H4-8]
MASNLAPQFVAMTSEPYLLLSFLRGFSQSPVLFSSLSGILRSAKSISFCHRSPEGILELGTCYEQLTVQCAIDMARIRACHMPRADLISARQAADVLLRAAPRTRRLFSSILPEVTSANLMIACRRLATANPAAFGLLNSILKVKRGETMHSWRHREIALIDCVRLCVVDLDRATGCLARCADVSLGDMRDNISPSVTGGQHR